jgi:hypothetical protein
LPLGKMTTCLAIASAFVRTFDDSFSDFAASTITPRARSASTGLPFSIGCKTLKVLRITEVAFIRVVLRIFRKPWCVIRPEFE